MEDNAQSAALATLVITHASVAFTNVMAILPLVNMLHILNFSTARLIVFLCHVVKFEWCYHLVSFYIRSEYLKVIGSALAISKVSSVRYGMWYILYPQFLLFDRIPK